MLALNKTGSFKLSLISEINEIIHYARKLGNVNLTVGNFFCNNSVGRVCLGRRYIYIQICLCIREGNLTIFQEIESQQIRQASLDFRLRPTSQS